MIERLLTENGVRVRLGVEASEFFGADRVSGLRLTDGAVIPADVVVVAVGSTPAIEWLRKSELELVDGVVCDPHGEAAPHVWAVGDVACWRDRVSGEPTRTEHQLSAIEQAQAVGRRIASGAESDPIVPFFWSELFGTRILVHGVPENGPLRIVAGGPAIGRFVAASYSRQEPDEAVGLIGWNMPREFRAARADSLLERIPVR
jgi:NADPH-dependent 2,4-dienoyl-CoA reductase/sulfur reductase-like enzyme